MPFLRKFIVPRRGGRPFTEEKQIFFYKLRYNFSSADQMKMPDVAAINS